MQVNRRDFLALGAGGLAALGLPAYSQEASSEKLLSAEVCVYGGNASGVMAAVAAAREGCSVIIVEPSRWLGGMTGGGIDEIDWGRPSAVGGSAQRLLGRPKGGHSGISAEGFGNKDYRERLSALAAQYKIQVLFEHRLSRVLKEAQRIVGIEVDYAPPGPTGIPAATPREVNARQIRARVFIDCSYEGDLMAMSGVSYTFGRESTEQYGESLNGVQPVLQRYDIDPYRIPGDPKSGLIPLLQDIQMPPLGSADKLMMAYCFRFGFDFGPDVLPITPSDDYDPAQFEVFRRGFQKGIVMTADRLTLSTPDNYASRRDSGAKGPLTNNISRCLLTHAAFGANREYPDGDWATRSAIWKYCQDYVRNVTHFLRTAPEVPPEMQAVAKTVGLVPGDFDDTAGWPHQLYIREARRMVSSYVITQHDVAGTRHPEDSVGLASYGIDDFPYAVIADEGQVALSGGGFSIVYLGEGVRKITPGQDLKGDDLFLHPGAGMYQIPYRAIVPHAQECQNLFVPVCCSASHTAMTSLRMEPVWMILGESAGVAAAMALKQDLPVQQVNYATLRARLLELGQVLDIPEVPLPV